MIPKRRAVLVILLGVLLVLTSAGSLFAAQESIGKVTDIDGKVTSTSSAGVKTLLSLDSPINFMDRIVTSSDGKLGIKFNDKTYVAIGPESDVTIDNYVYKYPGSKDNSFNLDVVKGLFMIVGGDIAKEKPEKFTVKTGIAMIGIRGTSFGFMYELAPKQVRQFNRTGTRKLRVRSENFYATNFDGAVWVANQAGTVEMDRICEYCWVKPTKVSRLAFLDGPVRPAMLFTGAAPDVGEATAGTLMLARVGLPGQGGAPTSECDPDAASQFSSFFSTVFSGFSGITTTWVHRLKKNRIVGLITAPLIHFFTGRPPGGEGEGEGSPSGGPSWCFHPTTKVLLANGSAKEISKIKVGDMVQSYNVDKGTVEGKLVTRLYSSPMEGYYVINDSIKVTEKHPFLMAGPGNIWKKAADLKVGDRVQSVNGATAIESVGFVKGRGITYNFLVKDTKAFIVEGNHKHYVVHNGL